MKHMAHALTHKHVVYGVVDGWIDGWMVER